MQIINNFMKTKEELELLSKEDLVDKLVTTQGHLLKATQNLGHPAYGLSSSTTFGIDELREELFDFLEIPKTT